MKVEDEDEQIEPTVAKNWYGHETFGIFIS